MRKWIRKQICRLFHWHSGRVGGATGYQFNDKYPRFTQWRQEQHRYLRRCVNCGREQLMKVDALGYSYWVTVTPQMQLDWANRKQEEDFTAKYGNLKGEA